ncbi:MAG: carboxypeptidase-like regulatory domain-containing protein, partial [Ignavibacteriaceae bacterium]|nr:carboxypeptidase-like regulatory domain-containing protein [Ignavibacteriaceae bacterium]
MHTINIINKIYKDVVFLTVIILFLYSQAGIAGTTTKKEIQLETINFTVSVIDSSTSQPLQLVTVILLQDNSIIATGTTNPFGRAVFNDIESGKYVISARYIGYGHFTDTISIDTSSRAYLIKLKESSVELNEINIKGERINNVPTSIDMHTGQQVFEGENYHAAPTSSMTQLIQQNLAGAAKAPTGEVHIRGQHGEFSYLIDGIPVPLGVFGGLNEIVDPKVISKVSFLTAGFPAEYGGQITGLMDVQTRIPSGKFHLDLSTYGGSYLTSNNDTLGSRVGTLKALNLNGQSFAVSDHLGKLGYFIEASREETDRRINQPVQPLFNDHGFDYFTYGKFDYLLNENDYLTANINYSRT